MWNREPPAAEMIQRSQFTRGQRRCDEARPMRQHQAQLLRHKRGVRCDDKAVRAVGEIPYEYSVEVRLFMGLREAAHVLYVDRRPTWRMSSDAGCVPIIPMNSTLMGGLLLPRRFERGAGRRLSGYHPSVWYESANRARRDRFS